MLIYYSLASSLWAQSDDDDDGETTYSESVVNFDTFFVAIYLQFALASSFWAQSLPSYVPPPPICEMLNEGNKSEFKK